MPSPSIYPDFPEQMKPSEDEIDKSKRYDIYSTLRGNEVIVYHNVLIKGKKTMFPADDKFRFTDTFVELQQANGETIYINRHAILAICEHGTGFSFEKL
jgi:hypothetical protein